MTGLTAELVVDGRAPQTPVLAPNGQLLCYVLAPTSRAGDHLDTELWLVDIDGAEDTNVPLGQAVYLHRALRHFGVEHEFVIYPREGHSFRERNHQLDVMRRTRAWFDRWLQP